MVILVLLSVFAVYPVWSSTVCCNNTIVTGLFYSSSEKKMLFQSIQEQNVHIGTHTVLSKSLREFRSKVTSNNVGFCLQYRFSDKVEYLLKLKSITNQSCRFDSSDYNFGSFDTGFGFLLSARFSLFPETLVNPGVYMNTGIEFERYNFNFISNVENNKTPIEVELQSVDICCGLAFEKKLSRIFSLYISGNMVMRTSDIKDRINLFSISGKEYTFDMSLNATVSITEKERLILSVSRSVFTDSTFLGSCVYAIKFN